MTGTQYYLWTGFDEKDRRVYVPAANETEAREFGRIVGAVERRSRWPIPMPEDMRHRWETLRHTREGIDEARVWVFDAVRLGWITWATLAQLVESIEQAAAKVEARIKDDANHLR